MAKKTAKQMILETIKEKSKAKKIVYNKTFEGFKNLKLLLKSFVDDINKDLEKFDKDLLLKYNDRGDFEAEIKVAGDLLIFNMHTNIFEFDDNHGVWKISYVKNDKLNSYCGTINIYNFLSDSFKYNRLDDIGYLIGRIFINKENHFFVEGKRQLGFLYNDFTNGVFNKESIKKVIESTVLYALDFDLLVPPYKTVNIASVMQIKENINNSKVATGKRLGFQFYTDSEKFE